MKIAHLLPTSAVFPLKKHNGRYEWALRLAKLQVAAGHEVTIFAGEHSTDDSPIIWQSIHSESGDKKQRNIELLTKAFSNSTYDVFHSHFDALHYLVADLTDKPVIVTQHWFPQPAFADAVKYNTKHNVITVPVTKLMQDEDATLGIPSIDYLYHGIDLSLFSYNESSSDRLLFVGRIHPSKGIDKAIHYALKTNSSLDIIGKVNQGEEAFWNDLLPFIDGEKIRYLGPKSLSEVATAYQHAKAFLFPSSQAEAFGQVTIEAQACGTPVIISDVGASSELVIDGVTGFVCTTEDEFIEAINAVSSIDRRACRTHAEKFDIIDMEAAYTKLYEAALTNPGSALAQ